MRTKDKLARALLKCNDSNLKDIIKRARQGYYDDFFSPLVYPQTQLLTDLLAVGHPEFVQRVFDGEFDASEKESDAWRKSPEGRIAAENGEALYFGLRRHRRSKERIEKASEEK